MILKGTKQLGLFQRGINLYIPKRNPGVTCSDSEAQVLMEGWEFGPRTLTRQSETLYVYGAETVYRADSVSPWSYANAGSPFVTSLTIAPFPWQAIWPAPFTATKVCP